MIQTFMYVLDHNFVLNEHNRFFVSFRFVISTCEYWLIEFAVLVQSCILSYTVIMSTIKFSDTDQF